MIIILAVIVILVVVGWLLSNSPEGEEIPGVGFVRKEKTK